MEDPWESKMLEMVRRGQRDRVKYIQNLYRTILPAQVKRVQQNDKTVLKDLVLPEWLDWELLYEWSMRRRIVDNPRECILCNEVAELGVDYNQKFLCESCFFRIKGM